MTPRSVSDERDTSPDSRWTATYRMTGLCLSIVFAVVGLVFLLAPRQPLRFFNELSLSVGLASSPVVGVDLFHVLAVGYMYIVTLLAWFMYRMPANRLAPVLLVNAKLASSVLSFIFFFAVHGALIFLVNGMVDGLIGAGVFALYLKQRRGA
jgi:hypothetical protein